MKARIAAACAVLGASAAIASSAFAVTVTFGGTPGGSSGVYSAVPGVTTIDFESALPAGWLSGDYQVVRGSVVNHYAAPPNTGPDANTSWYLTVPYGQSSGTADISLGASYNYYGLYWGSIDDYNTLSFWNGDEEVFRFTGSQAAALIGTAPNGNQGIAAYFNFFDLPRFTGVRLSSTQYAFETDNHAFGQVPLPASGALFALGLLGLAGVRRARARAR